MITTYICVILFIGVMIYLGYIGMKRTKTVSDFFLAGRNIGPWLSAFSYGTTYFSAVIFVGFAGRLGWKFGMRTLWISFGNTFLGAFCAWIALAKRTHAMTTKLNVMTMPEFLEARYQSRGLKPLAAFIIFIFLIPYSASVYQGLGYLFEQGLQIPFEVSLFFIAGLTGIYLVMGGYHAINIADMIQGIIMIVGALLMVFFFVNTVGGVGEATRLQNERYWSHFAKPGERATAPESALEADRSAGENPAPPPNPKPTAPAWWMLLSLVILTSLGPWGLPQMVQKFYAIKNKSIIPKALVITTLFALIIAFVAYFCGALTHIFFEPGKELAITTSGGVITTSKLPMTAAAKPTPDFDALIPIMLQRFTPRWLNTAVLLLILSASMSTLSGLVLVSSSAIAIDLFQGRNPDEKRRKQALILMRVLCAIFVLASVGIALGKIMVIVNLMSLSWGAVAGCFLAPYLYGLFCKRVTKIAVWISMISALVITIGGYLKFGAALSPVYGSLSMIIPLVILPVASLFTPALSEKHVDSVFDLKDER
ncbi:sodium:solute symporter family protein [Candidatus Sumerlaeota bacterium]|nr:sodium:solute symporter family protein [Candidatus Sumerlaeota bacterium]